MLKAIRNSLVLLALMCAVGAWELMRAAAGERGKPLTPLTVIAAAAVPVCVHLDHGETLDYLKKALDIGFTSIMYDGSVLPYDENLKNTRLAVEMAGKAGASVEA